MCKEDTTVWTGLNTSIQDVPATLSTIRDEPVYIQDNWLGLGRFLLHLFLGHFSSCFSLRHFFFPPFPFLLGVDLSVLLPAVPPFLPISLSPTYLRLPFYQPLKNKTPH